MEKEKLRAFVVAVRRYVTERQRFKNTTGLDMSNYHGISIHVPQGRRGQTYHEADWEMLRLLEELEKELDGGESERMRKPSGEL